MAININVSVWGKKEHLIQPTSTSYRHTCILYPYYVATDEYFTANPTSFVSQRNALYNVDHGIEQTTDVSTVDMSLCSWSIPTAAAVNHVWYMGRYNDGLISTTNAGLVEVTVDDRQAYPTYFTMGNKKYGYTDLNNSSHLLDGYNYNINTQSAEYRTRIGSDFPALSEINTPIASFGYKSALNVVYVTCCTETYFYETIEYGDILTRIPTTVSDGSSYSMPLYNYFHNEINGIKINELFPIVLNVEIKPFFDHDSSNNETSNPTREYSLPYIYPMSLIKYRSLKDVEDTTIFGNNTADPWYNNSHVYWGYWGFLILGMYYASANFSARMSARKTSAIEALADYTRANETSQLLTWHYCRSKQLESKEITKLIRYDEESCYIRLGYSGLTEAEILREAAYQGLWFAADESKVNVNLYDVVNGTADLSAATENGKYIFMPKFDEHLVTTGEYVSAYDINSNPAAYSDLVNINWGWRFNLSNDYTYDPTYDPPAPTPDIDDTDIIVRNTYNPYGRFFVPLKEWCLYQQNVETVVSAINSLYLSNPDGTQWELDFKGSNPADYIISCIATPIQIAHSDNPETFTLGPVDFDGTMTFYRYNDTGYFTFGSVDFPAYGNFLDYPPYTTAELYIPLCGTTDIDPVYFAGHSIEVVMFYDILTGSCAASIYRDSFELYKTINGKCGAEIPLTSLRMGDYQNAVNALHAAQKQNDIRIATSLLTVAASAAAIAAAPPTGGASLIAGAGLLSGIGGVVSATESAKKTDYDITHTQPAISQTSAAESQNEFCVGGNLAILRIKRPKFLSTYNAETYGKTVGFACCINSTVGAFDGFTVFSDVDLSGIPATAAEIDVIRSKLNSGIYI